MVNHSAHVLDIDAIAEIELALLEQLCRDAHGETARSWLPEDPPLGD